MYGLPLLRTMPRWILMQDLLRSSLPKKLHQTKRIQATFIMKAAGSSSDIMEAGSSMHVQSEWLEPKEKDLVRIFADCIEIEGWLGASLNGFAVAKFDCGAEVETEFPKSTLAPVVVMKKPTGSRKRKGPVQMLTCMKIIGRQRQKGVRMANQTQSQRLQSHHHHIRHRKHHNSSLPTIRCGTKGAALGE